jgi:hypothetical protein
MADSERMASKQDKKETAKPAPTCKAILLCDDVIRDETTHKTSVIGIFDTFYLPSLPGPTSPCKIFLLLADAVGRYSITAEVHDTKRGVVLFRSPGSGEFASPGKTTKGELWLPVSALPFDAAGAYDLVVFADKTEVGRVQFKVRSH